MKKVIQNSKLRKYLEERSEIQKELIATDKQREAIEKELNKTALKMQKIKDKTIPIMVEYEKEWREDGTLGEFDIVSSVRIEKDEVVAVIIDQVESYKDILRKKQTSNNNNSTQSDSGRSDGQNDEGKEGKTESKA